MDHTEIVDLTAKELRYEIGGRTCDDRGFTLKASFTIQLNPCEESLLDALEKLSASQLSDAKALHELFKTKFCEAVKSVASRTEALFTIPDEFWFEVLQEIGGPDLNHGFNVGFAFIDLAIK